MKFVCDRCQTRYSIADEKVRGKILKVRCKSCQNVITVREASIAGSEAAAPQVNEDRTVLAPAPTAAEPFATPAGRASATMSAVRASAPPPVPPARDDVQWYLALDGNRTGPFSRKALLDKLAALSEDADVHVWNEKLDGWKEPNEVPALARELQARRRPPMPPMPGAGLHSAPHPVPSLGRRTTTGSQPALAASAPASPRKTSHGLPAPSGAVEPPLAAAAATHPASPTGAPRGRKTANGVALNGGGDHGPALVSGPAAPMPLEPSGMPGEEPWTGPEANAPAADEPLAEAAATAGTDVARPTGWQIGSVPLVTTSARHRSANLMLASLGIVAVIVVLVMFSFLNKKAPPAASVEPSKGAANADNSFAELADKLAQPGTQIPEPAGQPTIVPSPESKGETMATVRGAKGAKFKPGKNKKGRGGAVQPTSPPPLTTAGTAPAGESPPAPNFGSERQVQLHSGGGARSAPGQGEITRVINNNKAGIKICYQRALLKDSTLTHGKIAVHVTLGLSGKVKNVGIDGPASFFALQPCIKDMVSRWAFPPSSEAYETEFSYVFQGNE